MVKISFQNKPLKNFLVWIFAPILGILFFSAWAYSLDLKNAYMLSDAELAQIRGKYAGVYFSFDFSGYCDMAIGLALMFGIRLPLNFYSPYKATSIIDFWRRWHITLANFIRDYLYIPMGGNRKGFPRQIFQ